MNSARQTYILHAEIVRSGSPTDDFDDARAGHPLERRLNRIERAAATFGGHIQLRFSNGMRVLFQGAEAALLGACEMQIRCSLLPLVAQQRMSLRVGIECLLQRQRAHDSAVTQAEATRLAVLDDGIVVAPCLANALTGEQRKLLHPLAPILAQQITDAADTPFHCIDWRLRIGTTNFADSLAPPAENAQQAPSLTLRHGEQKLVIDSETQTISIGRDPRNLLCVDDVHSSRHHCHIQRDGQFFVLTDTSTNGTTIVPESGEPHTLKNASTPLAGRGILIFGRPFKGDRRGGIRFEIR